MKNDGFTGVRRRRLVGGGGGAMSRGGQDVLCGQTALIVIEYV